MIYYTFGKEGPDGGMNEAGLYVGEMTLTKAPTVHPQNDLPRFYPHLWIQYLLDNYATVEEAIESLKIVRVGGPMTWHFFIADREGKTAAIEFLESGVTVHQGDDMPIPR
jgi:penicillin V acylase-like amidase (Ntn superfamily)